MKKIISVLVILGICLIPILGYFSRGVYSHYHDQDLKKTSDMLLNWARSQPLPPQQEASNTLLMKYGLYLPKDFNETIAHDNEAKEKTVLHISRILDQCSEDELIEFVELIIASGFNLDTPLFFGDALLASVVDREIAKSGKAAALLIAAGADVHIQCYGRGNTALHNACQAYDNITNIELLIACGADINAKTNNGKTPLCRAVEHMNREAIRFLIQHGAIVNFDDLALKESLSLSDGILEGYIREEQDKLKARQGTASVTHKE